MRTAKDNVIGRGWSPFVRSYGSYSRRRAVMHQLWRTNSPHEGGGEEQLRRYHRGPRARSPGTGLMPTYPSSSTTSRRSRCSPPPRPPLPVARHPHQSPRPRPPHRGLHRRPSTSSPSPSTSIKSDDLYLPSDPRPDPALDPPFPRSVGERDEERLLPLMPPLPLACPFA